MKTVIIQSPIIIIPSKAYGLVINDARGIYHYFNRDGSYDGWSKDCKPDSVDDSWLGSKVKCDLCNHVWIAVFSDDCDKLECPHCHHMVEFEVIE